MPRWYGWDRSEVAISLNNMKKITKEQRNAIVILSVGTFLEYFDLMLYVHMAVVLDSLFFPQYEAGTKSIFAAVAFCSTFVLRPLGGYFIGMIGDKIGRKSTIMITTLIMSLSCLTIANTATYEEIGITASFIIILCRMAQGFSSLGESMGALLYLSEMLKTPMKYVACGVINTTSRIGGVFALIVSLLSVTSNLNWRVAFYIGAGVAVIGFFARIKLRETPEFVDYKRRIKIKKEISELDPKIQIKLPSAEDIIDKKVIFAFISNILIIPMSIYVCYIYMGSFAKETLGLSAQDVINQNLKLGIIGSIGTIAVTLFCRKYHPLKLERFISWILITFIPFLPYILKNITNVYSLLLVQLILYLPLLNSFSNIAIWFSYFPVVKRFRTIALYFGITTSIGYAIASFGLIPLIKYMGYYGLLMLYIPLIVGFYYGISFMINLEREKKRYDDYPNYTDNTTPHSDNNFKHDLNEEYKDFNLNCSYSVQLLNKIAHLNTAYNANLDVSLIKKAMIFAKKWHGKDLRKNGRDPFYSHPFKVAEIVAKCYYNTNTVVASILHDVVEDTDCNILLIEKFFNSRISKMVNRLTKVQIIDGVKVKLTLKQIIENLYKHQDYESILIKEIDRLHNLKTMEPLTVIKQKQIATETLSELVGSLSYIAEKLNIYPRLSLENTIFKTANNILKKNKNE